MASSTDDFAGRLVELTQAAHLRLDAAGVDRYSCPVPWHIARTTTLTQRPWPSRPQTRRKERSDASHI